MRIPLEVERLARQQSGVVATHQLLDLGVAGSWVDRRVREERWRRLHPGVLVVHTGPLTWRARTTAALLHAGPGAALSHASAAVEHRLRDRFPAVVEVVVPHERRVVTSGDVRVVRRRVMPPVGGALPTVDAAHTVVDLLDRVASTDDVVGLLTTAARAGVPPGRVLDVVGQRARVRERPLLVDLLTCVADGIESPLELRYQRDVERAHGLPQATLQQRHRLGGGWIRADRVYDGLGVRAELDGRLGHPGGRTDADTWRDNAVLLDRLELTLRYRWRHVVVTPCATAAQVVAALRARGWTGTPRRCRRAGCVVR